jgi:putative transposase
MIAQRTYSWNLYDSRFFELAKEAGNVYSASLEEFWKVYNENGVWLSKFDLQKHMKGKIERKLLHSDSFLGAMQQVHANLASWKEARKINEKIKPPTKTKFLQAVLFKKSQIRYRDNYLKITLGTDKEFLFVKWNNEIPIPTYGSITYSKTRGWKINLVVETDLKEIKLNNKKFISIDLGVKRIATLFDGKNAITLSGKKLLELIHYRNKNNADTQSKLSQKKKDSNNYKKIKRAQRKSVDRLLNKQKDVLHKYSRFVVNYAVQNKIGNIIIGDNTSTHDSPNLGKNNNQKISQNPEQKLKNYIKYKFEGISGQTRIVPEPYTSQTCPCCKHRYKPNNRTYKCSECGFVYDRDGVGAINIYNENVSFDFLIKVERIRSLPEPIGIKFRNDFYPKLSYGLNA